MMMMMMMMMMMLMMLMMLMMTTTTTTTTMMTMTMTTKMTTMMTTMMTMMIVRMIVPSSVVLLMFICRCHEPGRYSNLAPSQSLAPQLEGHGGEPRTGAGAAAARAWGPGSTSLLRGCAEGLPGFRQSA